ncbi:FAD-dependent monooxygenase [Taibaiella soli]|uniref:FAD-dependent oxidoreductase n=1 Tax=Taibaiella soli TaxID=1649169 RepID=A0A2W2AAW3_9BACT|nr:FAD-dependent monooxygenase [Taibaiella soli]PZF72525.1 FAD-dependent oxidoreductase [Taibaiella soli]
MNTTFESNQRINDHPVYDVIISGAGPVGLFLACELALAKCSVLILEQAENPSSPLKRLPFGIRGLSAPSVEAIYRRGMLGELTLHKRVQNPHQHAKEGAQRQAGHFAGIPFQEGNIDTSDWKYRLPCATAPNLLSEMEELETVFTRKAEALGVTIRRGFAVINFQQTEDTVTVEANHQMFKGKWLVGCDGARSIVRKLGGFEFAGTEPEFTGYTTLLDIADPEKLKPGRNVTDKGMYMQSQPGYVLLQDFDGGAFHHSKQAITREYIQEVLRRISDTDVTISALHTATTWTDRARQATAYRNGRVLLAGDAAHIHSPLGGQGLNLGLGDAMNLGWKLAATIHNNAPEGLLDSYYNERYPVGAQVLDWSRAQVSIMKPSPEARAMYAIVRDLMNTSDGATYFAARVWGVFMHYDLGGGHPLTGYSVPNFELMNDTAVGELMHGGNGILLDFDNDTALKELASRYNHLEYVSSAAKDELGLRIVLIRPDGIVAWAADNNPEHETLKDAIDRWFVRKSA